MPDQSVILLAEDRQDDIILIQKSFAKAYITNPLQVVRDGEEAIAYLEGSGKFSNRQEYPLPDIILMDLKMPRKNGLEVLDWWHRQPHLAAIRIVVLTTSEEMRDVNAAYRLGAASFIVKPLHFADFRITIFAMLQYWRNNQPGESSREGDAKRRHENGSSK